MNVTTDTALITLHKRGIMSTRLYNGLNRAGYKTVGDIMKSSWPTLAKIRNVGVKSIISLHDILESYGLTIPRYEEFYEQYKDNPAKLYKPDSDIPDMKKLHDELYNSLDPDDHYIIPTIMDLTRKCICIKYKVNKMSNMSPFDIPEARVFARKLIDTVIPMIL